VTSFASKPADDATVDEWLKWMDDLDKFRYNLLEQIVVITKKTKMSEDFLIKLPRMERIHILNIVNKVIEKEEEAANEAKGKNNTKRKSQVNR
jgi:hypothetical protein